MQTSPSISGQATTLEIIAFHLGDQQFCIKTTSIREIRAWAAATPLPHAPPHVLGMMNLRGSVIPIINLAAKLGVQSSVHTSRSAMGILSLAPRYGSQRLDAACERALTINAITYSSVASMRA